MDKGERKKRVEGRGTTTAFAHGGRPYRKNKRKKKGESGIIRGCAGKG